MRLLLMETIIESIVPRLTNLANRGSGPVAEEGLFFVWSSAETTI